MNVIKVFVYDSSTNEPKMAPLFSWENQGIAENMYPLPGECLLHQGSYSLAIQRVVWNDWGLSVFVIKTRRRRGTSWLSRMDEKLGPPDLNMPEMGRSAAAKLFARDRDLNEFRFNSLGIKVNHQIDFLPGVCSGIGGDTFDG